MRLKELLFISTDRAFNIKVRVFLDGLMNSQELSTLEVKAGQWARLKELLEFTYQRSEFYRSKFRECGLTPDDIKSEFDFQKLPIINREDVRNCKALISGAKSGFFINSSGTGKKDLARTFVDFESACRKYAVYLRHLYRFGWDFDTSIVYFLPSIYRDRVIDCRNGLTQLAATFIQNRIAHNFFTNREIVFHDNSLAIDEKTLKAFCKKIGPNNKTIIMGRADFLNILIYNLKKSGCRIQRPKAVVNIGFLLPEVLRDRFSSFFDCPVYNIYGSSEFSYIAGSCRWQSDLHINEETHYVEIDSLDCKRQGTNNPGNIVVTDLVNFSMPLIRYSTNDLGYIRQDDCSSYNSRLLDVKGRSTDVLLNSDGNAITVKDICNKVFLEENILRFILKSSNNHSPMELRIPDGQVNVNEARLLTGLNEIGLRNVKLSYVNGFSMPRQPDKPVYLENL